MFEEGTVFHGLYQGFVVFFVEVLEDGETERLYLSYHVPTLVFLHVVVDVVHYPLHHIVVDGEVFYHFVYGEAFHLPVVEFDAQVGGKVQFACEVSQHTLEEGVNGFDTKEAIVVYEQVKGGFHLLSKIFHITSKFFGELVGIAFRIRILVPNAIELTEYTHLHFLRGLVCKGNGKDITILHGVFHEQLDVVCGKGEGLSASGACLINGQCL